MTMINAAVVRRGMLSLAGVFVLAGCAAQPGGVEVESNGPAPRPPAASPSAQAAPANFLCPGEHTLPTPIPTSTPTPTPTPTPTGTSMPTWGATPIGPTVQVTDHYQENHGFQVPFPLFGQSRCDGRAAVARVEKALEPLRKRGDFDTTHVHDALVALGYPAGTVWVGGTGSDLYLLVTVNTSPLCVEGTMDSYAVSADAFGGYPDHAGCDRPQGGH